MINFNVPPFTGNEMKYIEQAVEAQTLPGKRQLSARIA